MSGIAVVTQNRVFIRGGVGGGRSEVREVREFINYLLKINPEKLESLPKTRHANAWCSLLRNFDLFLRWEKWTCQAIHFQLCSKKISPLFNVKKNKLNFISKLQLFNPRKMLQEISAKISKVYQHLTSNKTNSLISEKTVAIKIVVSASKVNNYTIQNSSFVSPTNYTKQNLLTTKPVHLSQRLDIYYNIRSQLQ